MSEKLLVFRDGFQSTTADGERQAVADYVTNALRVFNAVDDPTETTLVHVFVVREEFMHGEWTVALAHTCARLRLAAIEALYEAIKSPDRRSTLMPIIYRAWVTADRIDETLEPFKEAVDKLQVLSVIDEEFRETVVDNFETTAADATTTESALSDRLEDRIQQQRRIARGETVVGDADDSLYVNPLYYYALREVVDNGGRPTPDDEPEESPDGRADSRSVAETVARVTLDVPEPLRPLAEADPFDPLAVGSLDVDALTIEDLQAMTDDGGRYDVSDADYERYLLRFADRLDHPQLAERFGTSTDEVAADELTWLDAVFVKTLKSLETLAERADTDITEMAPEDLRQRLGKMVHGVDYTDQTTMRDRPTALLDLPATASEDAPDEEYLEADCQPHVKVLFESFEQHGSFAALTFLPSDDDGPEREAASARGLYQNNWHAVEAADVSSRSDVPAGIDSFEELWEHYFVGKQLILSLFEQYEAYRTRLQEALAEAYHSPAALEHALEYETPLPVTTDGRSPAPGRNIGVDDGSRPRPDDQTDSPGSAADGHQLGVDLVEEDGLSGAFTTDSSDPEMQALLDRSVVALRKAARALDVPVPDVDDYPFDPVSCPVCALTSEPCSGDGCDWADRCRQFDDQLPHLVEALAHQIHQADN